MWSQTTTDLKYTLRYMQFSFRLEFILKGISYIATLKQKDNNCRTTDRQDQKEKVMAVSGIGVRWLLSAADTAAPYVLEQLRKTNVKSTGDKENY